MRAAEFLTERRKKKKRNRRYSGYFFPGYGYYGSGTDGSEGSAGDGGGGESVKENASSDSNVIFLNDTTVIVGQEHGKPLKLSDENKQRIQAIADEHGAWYEGNGMDQKHTKGIIDDYKGSWDDDLLSPAIKDYPFQFLYVLFSNIKENDTIEGKIGFDPKSSIFDRILDTQPSTNYFPDRQFDAETLEKFLRSVSEGPYDFVQMSQEPATEKNITKFFTQGEKLMFPDNWEEYPYRAGRVAKSVNDLRDKFLATRKKGVYVAGSDHLKAVQQFLDQAKQGVAEGQDDNGISFQIQKGKNKFATTLSIGNNSVGVYQYDANTGRSIAEVYPEFKGKGLGKLLVLHAIYTAAKLGLDFQEDESRTSEYDNVLDSLSGSGYIVDDEGYWYVTGEGEQFLKQSLKQGVAEGLNESLSSIVNQDQAERNEYANFVKSQAGGDWTKGAKMYAQLKKRPSNDIFGDAVRLNQFMKMKFDFDKFTDEDWDNYWLLAQHCDDNRDFQKNALLIIKKYQGTDHSHYKYLYDRISCGIYGTQKYGTQDMCTIDS